MKFLIENEGNISFKVSSLLKMIGTTRNSNNYYEEYVDSKYIFQIYKEFFIKKLLILEKTFFY
jgi:hypothetical protein